VLPVLLAIIVLQTFPLVLLENDIVALLGNIKMEIEKGEDKEKREE